MAVCLKCGEEKPDAMARSSTKGSLWEVTGKDGLTRLEAAPVLCTRCCSEYPGRAWMRSAADAEEAR